MLCAVHPIPVYIICLPSACRIPLRIGGMRSGESEVESGASARILSRYATLVWFALCRLSL